MAIYTITTSGVNVDSLTSKVGSDTYNINGMTADLTWDGHTRHDINGNTSAGIGTVQPSATLGGSIKFDATLSRLIYYTGGSGTVPAAGTTITQGTASGKLVGVYSALNVAPTAAAASMPTSGYILIKQWNSIAFASGAITAGLTANVAADPVFGTFDRVGWVEIVGVEGFATNLGRLNNQSTDYAKGDWFLIGVTGGSRSDTFQIPTNGVAQYHAGVILENPTISTGTNFVWDESDYPGAGYVTVTSTSHGFEDNDIVTITGVSPSAFNVTNVRITKINSNSFKYPMRANPSTYVSGGTVTGQPEKIPVTTTAALVANIDTDSLRGKWCWIDPSTGIVRFGNDGTNSTGGWLPPSGRTVSMPNLFLQNCTSAAKTVNSHNSSLNSRYLINTTNAGVLNMSNVSANWRMNVITTAKSTSITDSFFCDQLGYTTVSSTILLTRVCVSTPVVASNTVLSVSNNLGGLTAVDCIFSASEWTGSKVLVSSGTAYNFSFTRCRFVGSGQRTSNNVCVNTSIGTGFVYDQCVFGGGFYYTSQTTNIRIYHSTVFDCTGGTTQPSNLSSGFNFTNRSNDIIVNGVDTGGITNVGPRSALLTVNTASSNVKFYNAGTYSSPLQFGGSYVQGVSWTRSGTTITVTSTSHGLRTSDVILPYISSDTAPISTQTKTVTFVDANTFTFTGIASGAGSGTMSYFLTGTNSVINIGSGCTSVRVQNVHVRGNNAAAIINNNTVDTLTIKNFSCEQKNISFPFNRSSNNYISNSVMENSSTTSTNTAATYGTHFLDNYIRPPALSPITGATWTRSSNVITVTAVAHGITVTDRIFIYDSSDPTAAINGYIIATPLTEDTFTYFGVGTGAASGTLSIRREDSRLLIPGNEVSSLTTSQLTFPSGGASPTGAGVVIAPTVGDTVLWEMPDYIIGYDSFPQLPLFMGTGTLSNYDITYAIDTGSGFSVYRNLSVIRSGAGGASGQQNVTVTSTTGINSGDYVWGTGIPDGATVSSITNSTTFVLSVNTNATVSGALTFNHLPAEGTMPSSGFKLRVKSVTVVANSTAIAYLWIPMDSTTTSRNRLYPQDVDTYTFTISNIPSGSIIALYDSSNVELQRDDNVTSGIFQYDYIHSGSDTTGNYYVFWHEDYYPYKSGAVTLAAADQGVSIVPETDLLYDAAAPDISTFDYANEIHVMDPTVVSGGNVDIPGQDLYSNWKLDITLSDNFTYDFAYTVVGGQPTYSGNFVSFNLFQVNGWKLRPKEINHTGRITGLNLIPESGGAVVPTVGSYTALVEYQNPERSITVSSGSAVLPGDITDIAEAVWDEGLASHTSAGSAGKTLTEAADSAELAFVK